MKHAQREAALGARDLIVISLHRIDGAASELVVLGIRPEERAQQNARLNSLGMRLEYTGMTARIAGRSTAGKNFHLLPSPFSPHAVTAMRNCGRTFCNRPAERKHKKITKRGAVLKVML